MNFYPDERVILFIDGPSLHMTARALGFEVDYKELRSFFMKKVRLVRAMYYTTILEQQEFTAVRPLVDWLEYNGFTLITKPAKEFTDSAGRRRIKGDMDVELAVHAMQLADTIDHAVIFTGDGDFRSLVEALQQRGKRVSIVSTLETQPAMVADELRRQADQFIDLASLETSISRKHPAGRRPLPPRRGPDVDTGPDHDYKDEHQSAAPPPAAKELARELSREPSRELSRNNTVAVHDAKLEPAEPKGLPVERGRGRPRSLPVK